MSELAQFNITDPLVKLYDELEAAHKQAAARGIVMTVGNFVTTMNFAMKQYNEHRLIHSKQDMDEFMEAIADYKQERNR